MNGTYTIIPSPDAHDVKDVVYVPQDLEDALTELAKLLPPEQILELQDLSETEICQSSHFTLGAWMRSYWGLWSGSRLCAFFQSLGITHADDMTQIILASFWRRLNKKPLRLSSLVEGRQIYWKNGMN